VLTVADACYSPVIGDFQQEMRSRRVRHARWQLVGINARSDVLLGDSWVGTMAMVLGSPFSVVDADGP
jgi:hypothetical protein